MRPEPTLMVPPAVVRSVPSGVPRDTGAMRLTFSRQGDYAIRAMLTLAGSDPEGWVSVTRMSAAMAIPERMLPRVMRDLGAAGLVEARTGRAGGYRLARPADAIMVADIMSAVDEDTRMTRCHGVLPKAGQQHASSGCVGESRCLTHGLWEALGEQIRAFLGRVSLADVLSGHIPVEHFGPRANTARLQLGTGTVTQTQ